MGLSSIDAHPDLRDTAELKIFVGFLGLLARASLATVGGYFADLYRLATTRGGSVDAMVAMDEALAIADLVMLAIVADGVITVTEIARLEALHRARELPEGARQALEDFRRRIPGGQAGVDPSAIARAIARR